MTKDLNTIMVKILLRVHIYTHNEAMDLIIYSTLTQLDHTSNSSPKIPFPQTFCNFHVPFSFALSFPFVFWNNHFNLGQNYFLLPFTKKTMFFISFFYQNNNTTFYFPFPQQNAFPFLYLLVQKTYIPLSIYSHFLSSLLCSSSFVKSLSSFTNQFWLQQSVFF